MSRTGKDDAVSPVVGVMLMIVITVVIAAVITVFATGVLGDENTTTPVAMIEQTKLGTSGSILTYVEFVHKGGDPLQWENIEVTLFEDSRQKITNYFPGEYGTITISGKSGAGVSAEAGDYVRVVIDTSKAGNSENAKYESGNTVFWTLYDKRTDGILASGEFIVP